MKNKSDLMRECERVNKLLREEAVRLKLGTKGSVGRLEQSKSDASAFTYWAEMEFREYVRRMIEPSGSGNVQALVNGGARLLQLSPVTTKRYMGKMRAAGGPFAGLGDVVILNGRYVDAADDDYWLDEVEEKAPERAKKGQAQDE